MNFKYQIVRSWSFLLLLFVSTFAYSQNTFLPGFVVNTKGDTLKGYINNEDWFENPDVIAFKLNPGAAKVYYSPNDLKIVSVNGDVFVGAVVESDISFFKAGELTDDKELKIKMDTVFLKMIIGGPKSLYYYKSSNDKVQFYISKDIGYELLVYKRYLKRERNEDVVVAYNKYKEQLSYYLRDCQAIISNLERIKYDKESLAKIFKSYYSCTNTVIGYQESKAKPVFNYGVLAGASLLEFGNPSAMGGFVPGAFVEFSYPRNRGRWSIYTDLVYFKNQSDDSTIRYVSPNDYERHFEETEQSVFCLSGMFRYHIPVGNVKLFAGLGLSFLYVANGGETTTTEKKFYTMHTFSKENTSYDNNKMLVPNLALGAKYKKLSLELRAFPVLCLVGYRF